MWFDFIKILLNMILSLKSEKNTKITHQLIFASNSKFYIYLFLDTLGASQFKFM
jgi:hypothetical protein